MEDESTTGAAADQDGVATPPEPNATTDSQNDDGGSAAKADDLDTSKPADDSAGGDQPADDQKTDDSPSDAKFDTDLDDWAETTGRKKPESDEERRTLQTIRDDQRAFSRRSEAKKAAGELDTATQKLTPEADPDEDDDLDPIERRQLKLEEDLREERRLRVQSEFFSENGVSEDEVKSMTDILTEKVDRAKARGGVPAAKAALDFWTDPENLPDWYALARARITSSADTSEIAGEAARKERERIEKESKASGSNRNATSTQTSDLTAEQERKKRFENWD